MWLTIRNVIGGGGGGEVQAKYILKNICARENLMKKNMHAK